MKLKYYQVVSIFCLVMDITFNISYAQPATAMPNKNIVVYLLAGEASMEGFGGQIGELQKILCAVDEYPIPGDNCYAGLPTFSRLFETIYTYNLVNGAPDYYWDPLLIRKQTSFLEDFYNQGILTSSLLNSVQKVNVVQFAYTRNPATGMLNTPVVTSGPLAPGFGVTSTTFGPELLLGNYLNKFTDADILLIKVVQAGSDLYNQWRSPTMAKDLPPTNAESLYNKLIEQLNAVTGNISSYFPQYNGYNLNVHLGGFFWLQGFSDAIENNFTSVYHDNLIRFIDDLRNDLALPKLPVVISSDADNSANGNLIQQAQAAISNAIPFVKYS